MCNFAKKLTETPSKVDENDIQTVRDLDLSDKDISQIVQIIAYFRVTLVCPVKSVLVNYPHAHEL